MTEQSTERSPQVSPSDPLHRLVKDEASSAVEQQILLSPLRIALIYAALGAIWILFTDRFVLWAFPSAPLVAQSIKGILFIGVTTALVYWLARSASASLTSTLTAGRLRSMQRFANILLSSLGEAVLIIDRQSRSIAWCNTAAERVFGYASEELIGQSTAILHWDQQSFERFAAMGEPVLQRGETFNVRFTMRHKNGMPLETENTVTLLQSEDGSSLGAVSIIRDVSEIVQTQKELEQCEMYYRLLADNTLDVIWTMDLTQTFTYANPAIESVTGYTANEFIGTRLRDHCQREEYRRLLGIIEKQLTSGPGQEGVIEETKIVRKDGSSIPIEFHSTTLFENGNPVGLQGTARDISDRKHTEQALRDSEKQYRLTTENLNEVIYRADPETFAPTYVNKAVKNIYGYTAQEWLADSDLWISSLYAEDKEEVLGHFQQAKEETRSLELEYRIVCRNGNVRWVVDKITPETDQEGNLRSFIGVMDDITERKEQEEQLRHQAYHDLLTGLGNRSLLLERIDDVKKWAREQANQVAMFFIDLDNFKLVNDSMGHTFGDSLLQQFAKRLDRIKPDSALAVRYGGDEFILLTHLSDANAARTLCTTLRQKLSKPFYEQDYELFVSSSIGIALQSPSEATGLDLLRESDTALYEAKKVGRDNYHIFDHSMHNRASEQFQIFGDMHSALESREDEFFLVYQPIVRLDTLDVAGFEALIRWNHPKRGLLPPSSFIPVAEESGLIARLGSLVMDKACRQAAQWNHEKGTNPVFVSFNVSTKQLHQSDLVQRLDDLLYHLDLPPERIKVEVTESSVMEDVELSLNILSQLQDLGVKLQIDDFGTGYSSLKYLQRIPATNLKVDRAFVSDMEIDSDKESIVRMVKSLADNLDMGVVAEGVETAEQLTILRSMDVRYAQGFLFDKPLQPDEAGSRQAYPALLTGSGEEASG